MEEIEEVIGREGEIVGRPTLLAVYPQHLPVQQVLDGLRATGYPQEKVLLYYRVKGTDQVIDARTGRMAPGQSLTMEELRPEQLETTDTVVLMHPRRAEFDAVQQALMSLGAPELHYEGETHAESRLEGIQRHDEKV